MLPVRFDNRKKQLRFRGPAEAERGLPQADRARRDKMRYDFDKIIDRRQTGSTKWDGSILKNLYGDEDVLPLWLADMDFECPEPLVEALKNRAAHPIYGYTSRLPSYYEAVAGWMGRRHRFEVETDWFVYIPSVVSALNIALNIVCEKDDKVIIQTPTYQPFARSIESNGLRVSDNKLIYRDHRYEVDFDDFERLARDPRTRAFILCTPHNPSGRVFTREEIQRLGEICNRNGVFVISDEAHHDLVYEKGAHTVYASLGGEFARNCVVLTEPSKTFNVSGLYIGHIVIPDPEIRRKFSDFVVRFDMATETPFAIDGVEAMYRRGDEWMDQVLAYLSENIDFMENWLRGNLPQVKLVRPEATFLAWLDFGHYVAKGIDINDVIINKAKVALQRGSDFGESGRNFMRLCFACPRSLLEEAFARIGKEFSKL